MSRRAHNYKGRKHQSKKQGIGFALLLVAVVALILYFAFFSEVNRAMAEVFTEISQKLLPEKELPQAPEEPSVPPEPQPETKPEPPGEPAEKPVEERAVRKALYGGEAGFGAQNLVTEPYHALIVDLKKTDGTVTYLSQNETVLGAKATAADAGDIRAQIAELKGRGIYVIGRISCFKDQFAPKAIGSPILIRAGVSWLDDKMERWLNPYSPVTWNYLEAIVRDAAALGFDEVLLDDAVFPIAGKSALCNYGGLENGRTKTQCIAAFVEAMKAAAGETMKVSLVLERAGLETAKKAELLGQAFDWNALAADYLCPETDSGALPASLAGLRDGEKITPICKTVPPTGEAYLIFP